MINTTEQDLQRLLCKARSCIDRLSNELKRERREPTQTPCPNTLLRVRMREARALLARLCEEMSIDCEVIHVTLDLRCSTSGTLNNSNFAEHDSVTCSIVYRLARSDSAQVIASRWLPLDCLLDKASMSEVLHTLEDDMIAHYGRESSIATALGWRDGFQH